jgi:hypothetical protein
MPTNSNYDQSVFTTELYYITIVNCNIIAQWCILTKFLSIYSMTDCYPDEWDSFEMSKFLGRTAEGDKSSTVFTADMRR